MLDGEKYPYEIIRHNSSSAGYMTVEIVRGLSRAQDAVEYFNRNLTPEEKEQGWSHFLQRTTKKPWTKRVEHRVHDYKPGASRKR